MNNKYDIYFWDLDGTISNSQEGIFNSIKYALDKLNIEHPNQEVLNSFIGPPLYVSFMKHWFPRNERMARKAVSYYREYYADKGIYENTNYDGINEILESIKSKGAILIVATAKPTQYAKEVLKHSNIDHLFSDVYGSNMDGSRSSKIEIIKDIFKDHPEYKSKKCVMIGDRYYDLRGAKHHKIDGIGVLYGFGTKEELEAESPIAIVCEPIDFNYFI